MSLDEGEAAGGHADGCMGVSLDSIQLEWIDPELDEHEYDGGHEDGPHQHHAQLGEDSMHSKAPQNHHEN